MTVVTHPHIAVIIWTYSNRFGTNSINTANEVDQTIISTLSLKSINTSKSKSQASGTFELRLAPTKNWIATLTPGSWITILMSREAFTKEDFNKANSKKVKLFGRIDTVRMTTSPNQGTGARQTEYVVTGYDWGCVFNTNLYIDPIIRPDPGASNTPVAAAAAFIYQTTVGQYNGMRSLDSNIKTLIKLWGTALNGSKELLTDGTIVQPLVNFTIPNKVLQYFNFTDDTDKQSNTIGDLIVIRSGKLNTLISDKEYEDSYNYAVDATGLIFPEDVIGSHSMWSLMQEAGNPVLNEMICDLRWEKDKPKLCLYRRIRPFLINKKSLLRDSVSVGDNKGAKGGSNLSNISSMFKDLRRVYIPLEEILSFNAGTNWKDRINFIEVTHRSQDLNGVYNKDIKFNSQFYDTVSFAREGFKSYIASSAQYPQGTKKEDEVNTFNWEVFSSWKYLLKEWYFNAHNMLNGQVVFYGQDRYIQVGDNLIFDAKVLGSNYNMNIKEISKINNAYLLVHVENISHSATVNDNGVRTFNSVVDFVRGVIVDRNGNILVSDLGGAAVDQDSTELNAFQETNTNCIGIPTNADPDPLSHISLAKRENKIPRIV